MGNRVLKAITEFFRKRLVAIKRKPHTIPLLVFGVAYVYYSLNLSYIADSTTIVHSKGLGLTEFLSMLFGVLLLVCFMNAFPHRKKVNVPMLVIMFLMVGLVFYCDTYYAGKLNDRFAPGMDFPAAWHSFVDPTLTTLRWHRILLLIGVALTALLPVYTPLLRKINTNVRIEDNGNIGSIDLSGEDA